MKFLAVEINWACFSHMFKWDQISQFKNSEVLRNRSIGLFMTQSVRFDNQDLEIRSYVSSFSAVIFQNNKL